MAITNIHPHAAADTNALRDIKPPVEIPSGWAWLWWALVVLAVAGLAVLAWLYWRKRRAQAQVVPVVPAHVRAKQKLREALAMIGQPREFCILVSDTIRWYLEERFDFHAPERTTEEFLYELQGTNLLTPDQKASLSEFLNRCDLVKFAKYEPGPPELEDLHASAMRLVEETEPIMSTLEAVKVQGSTEPLRPSGLSPASVPEPTMPQMVVPRGQRLAIFGTILQLAPCIWVVTYLITILRLLRLPGRLQPADPWQPLAGLSRTLAEMDNIIGDAITLLVVGLVVGIVGLILLIVALTSRRYRAEWFFWFLLVYGVLLLGAFPFGTPVGIFFVVYCLTKRKEFLSRQTAAFTS